MGVAEYPCNPSEEKIIVDRAHLTLIFTKKKRKNQYTAQEEDP